MDKSGHPILSTQITREMLIDLCERGVVPVEQWHDRDSARSQQKLGEARALLRAGCDFKLSRDPKSDANTIWVQIYFPGFNAFEEGRDERAEWEDELFYIPTDARLKAREGGDWY